MKLTRKLLREHRVFNSHGVCKRGGGAVYVVYCGYGATGCPAWQVIGMHKDTDPRAPWYNSGHKTFDVYGDARAGSLPNKGALYAARRWAEQEFSIGAWERDLFGGWQARATLDKLRKELAP